MKELSHLTIIREDSDKDIFWDSAIFWKVVWKPDSIVIVHIVYRSKKNLAIIEGLRQEEVGMWHGDRFFRLHCT